MMKKGYRKTGRRISECVLRLILCLYALPVLALAAASFTDGGNLPAPGASVRLSLRQYADFFQSRDLLLSFRASGVLAGGAVLFGLPVAVLGGFWLHKSRGRLALPLRVLMTFALLLPVQSTMVPVFRLSRWTGLYDRWLSVILLQVFSPLGPLAVFYLLRTVPDEHWEAALLDCGSLLRIYRKAILPQLAPGLFLLAVLLFAEAWNLVEWPLILLPDPALRPASLSLNDLSPSGETSYAAALLYSLPALLFSGALFCFSRDSSVLH